MGPDHGGEPLGSILGPIRAKKWGPIGIGHNHTGSIFDPKGPPLDQLSKIFDPKVMGPNHVVFILLGPKHEVPP